MCEGFGMIVSNELRGYFCEPDNDGDVSHSEILRRLGWKENTDRHIRRFVRVECSDWTIDTFHFDENSTLPGWAEAGEDEIKALVERALSACAPAWAEYEKVRDAAWAEYEKVRAPARAEYEKVRDAALAEYGKVRGAAWAEMASAMSKVGGYVAAQAKGE